MMDTVTQELLEAAAPLAQRVGVVGRDNRDSSNRTTIITIITTIITTMAAQLK
jgi:hypothetical protein